MLQPDFNKWAKRHSVSSVSFMVPGSTWSEALERAEDARGQASASKDLKAARASVSILKRSEEDRHRCPLELLIFNGKRQHAAAQSGIVAT